MKVKTTVCIDVDKENHRMCGKKCPYAYFSCCCLIFGTDIVQDGRPHSDRDTRRFIESKDGSYETYFRTRNCLEREKEYLKLSESDQDQKGQCPLPVFWELYKVSDIKLKI